MITLQCNTSKRCGLKNVRLDNGQSVGIGVTGSDAYPSLITTGSDCACKSHYLHVPRAAVFGMSLLEWDTLSAADPRFDFSIEVMTPTQFNVRTTVGSDLLHLVTIYRASKPTTTDVIFHLLYPHCKNL